MSTSKVLYLSDSFISLWKEKIKAHKTSGTQQTTTNSSTQAQVLAYIFEPTGSLKGEGRNEEEGEKVQQGCLLKSTFYSVKKKSLDCWSKILLEENYSL